MAKQSRAEVEGTSTSGNSGCRNVLAEVKTCSEAYLAVCRRYGKSPCFSDVAFLQSISPDYPLLVLPFVDGAKNMECAFWYGNKR